MNSFRNPSTEKTVIVVRLVRSTITASGRKKPRTRSQSGVCPPVAETAA
jgi:hypothetical protein